MAAEIDRPRALTSLAAVLFFGGGCPSPAHPVAHDQPPFTQQVTAATTCSVRAVAVGDDGRVVAAFAHRGAITIAGRAIADAGGDTATIASLGSDGAVAWSRSFGAAPSATPNGSMTRGRATPGPVAIAGDRIVAALGATGSIQLDAVPMPVRGAPGAIVIGLDGATGATRFAQGLGSTDWVTVSSIAALPGGDVAVGGSFAGTLRAGEHVVTSAGASDGFVARLGGKGEVRWMIRVGGEGADGVTAVAALADRIAIAGTFTGEVDFRGAALAPFDDKIPLGDGFVAALGGDGTVAWARAFGSAMGDDVAGLAVTRSGRIAVAGTVRDVAYLGAGAASITAGGVEDWSGHGPADALVALWDDQGEPVGSALLGGADYDGARAIAARGDAIVVGAWFSGTASFGAHTLHAGGGADAIVAVFDDKAQLVSATPLTGDGREDVSALAASPAGYAAGLAFTTAATFADAHFTAPVDPGGGCAIVFRAR